MADFFEKTNLDSCVEPEVPSQMYKNKTKYFFVISMTHIATK